jgi:hypothetical protein
MGSLVVSRLKTATSGTSSGQLISPQVFRQANLAPALSPAAQAALARECLEHGAGASRQAVCALAKAKLEYVGSVLEICARFRCRAFASIVDKDSPSPASDHLRKDYAYLFERFFYYLEDVGASAFGIVVFDELEKVQSHLLIGQMDGYFKKTVRGRQRAGRILPEPLFVHSELTTGVQVADLVAYVVSWGFRFGGMEKPARTELSVYVSQLRQLRHRSIRDVRGNPEFVVWSFALIDDLRSQSERGTELSGEASEQ